MLRIEDMNGVRCIGLNRPEKRNAIGVELTMAMQEVLARSKYDTDISVLLFHGVGGHFSAGMDMKDFFDSSSRSPEVLQQARISTENWRTRLLYEVPQIIFSAVQGYCLGAAMPILNASDIVLASADASFGLPEINFGFVPGGQIVKAVGQMMPPRALAYAALTGRPFDAERARQWGLVTDIVPDPFERALELASAVADRQAA